MINGIHIYQGDCPDEVNGPYSRDKNCPVCQALLEFDLIKEAIKDETLSDGGKLWAIRFAISSTKKFKPTDSMIAWGEKLAKEFEKSANRFADNSTYGKSEIDNQ